MFVIKRENQYHLGVMKEQIQKLKGTAKDFWSGFLLFLKNLIIFFKTKDAKNILLEHLDTLHACAALLLEKERITRQEFEALFAGGEQESTAEGEAEE